MVEELKIYSCKFCGGERAQKGEAENCEHSHLHIKDMALDIIVQPDNDQFCYEPGNIWPTFIRVKIPGRSVDPKVYQLVAPRRRRGPSTTGSPQG